MHSSHLRGTDFWIHRNGAVVPHQEFLADVRLGSRLGLVAPSGVDGLGAACLVLACVTAFYDRCRAANAEFFSYPDFYTFQRVSPCVDYCMADIWPYHKNVALPPDAQASAEIIAHHGLNILLVPEEPVRQHAIDPVELDSLQRTVQRCFAYSPAGATAAATISISCGIDWLREFAIAILDAAEQNPATIAQREWWLAIPPGGALTQTFRELSLAEALHRL